MINCRKPKITDEYIECENKRRWIYWVWEQTQMNILSVSTNADEYIECENKHRWIYWVWEQTQIIEITTPRRLVDCGRNIKWNGNWKSKVPISSDINLHYCCRVCRYSVNTLNWTPIPYPIICTNLVQIICLFFREVFEIIPNIQIYQISYLFRKWNGK